MCTTDCEKIEIAAGQRSSYPDSGRVWKYLWKYDAENGLNRSATGPGYNLTWALENVLTECYKIHTILTEFEQSVPRFFRHFYRHWTFGSWIYQTN